MKEKLARTSPSIKRSEPDSRSDTLLSCKYVVSPDGNLSTLTSGMESAPTNSTKSTQSHVQSADHLFQYKNSDYFKIIKPCSITLNDIFDYNDDEPHCTISKCGIKNCKTCNILITDPYFSSSLTNKTFHTRSHDDLSCKSTNLIYGLECNLCGLIYVGETQERLNKRMCGHRSGINTTKFPTVYQHFNQQDHSILSMKVRILEKKLPSYEQSRSK